MAREVPEGDDPARGRHQIQTLILAVGILATVLLAVIFAVAALSWFNRFALPAIFPSASIFWRKASSSSSW